MTQLFFNGWASPIELFKNKRNFICHKDFCNTFVPFDERRFDIVAYSMGCHAAINFCLKHPKKVNTTTLIAYRKEYPSSEIRVMCQNLSKNPRSTLIHFYKKSIPIPEDWKYFKSHILDQALQAWSSQYLITLLKYAEKNFSHNSLEKISQNITFIHAENDNIAPLSEIIPLLRSKDLLITHNYGHLPFLNKNFSWEQV